MIKRVLILMIAMLLVIPAVFAAGTNRYPNTGGINQDYVNDGRGEFLLVNGEFDFDQFAKNLDNSRTTPIIDDFDNNGVSELIIIDDDKVRAYQNKELDIVSAVDFGEIPASTSNLLSFDIDGDGFNEIIFLGVGVGGPSNTRDDIIILNFTQADGLQIQNRFNLSTQVDPQSMIACRAPNECLALVTSKSDVDTFNPFTLFYTGYTFDSTGITIGIAGFTIFSETQASSNPIAFCNPRDQKIVVDDYDGDGNDEYIFSMGKKEGSPTDVEYRVFWLDNTTVEQIAVQAESVSELAVECGGLTGVTNSFTSPISEEMFIGEPKREACIGAQSSNDDFRIFCFSGSDASKVDEFPEEFTLLEADGTIVSNVVFGNFIPDTGTEDVCVMGFDSTEDRYELLCGSDGRSFPQLFSHAILEFPFSSLGFNISTDTLEQHHLIHGVQFSNEQQDLNDVNEILTTYGIFELDFSGVDNVLERIFNIGTTRGVNLAVDLEQFGQDDIISMTPTNIFYFDDKGSNNPAQLIDITYNPCIVNTLVKLNTTLQVTVEARDTNTFALGFDDLNFSVFAYSGNPNQQDRFAGNIPTSQVDGTAIVIFSPLFDLNQTGSGNILRVEVFDSENPTEVDSNEQIFSVGVTGLEFGDGTCTQTIIIIGEEEEDEAALAAALEAAIPDDRVDNGVTTGIITLSNLLGLGGTTIWLIIMVALSIGVWGAVMQTNREGIPMIPGSAALGLIAILNVLMIIIGARLGILSAGLVVIISVIAVVIIAVFLGRFLTGLRATD